MRLAVRLLKTSAARLRSDSPSEASRGQGNAATGGYVRSIGQEQESAPGELRYSERYFGYLKDEQKLKESSSKLRI